MEANPVDIARSNFLAKKGRPHMDFGEKQKFDVPQRWWPKRTHSFDEPPSSLS